MTKLTGRLGVIIGLMYLVAACSQHPRQNPGSPITTPPSALIHTFQSDSFFPDTTTVFSWHPHNPFFFEGEYDDLSPQDLGMIQYNLMLNLEQNGYLIAQNNPKAHAYVQAVIIARGSITQDALLKRLKLTLSTTSDKNTSFPRGSLIVVISDVVSGQVHWYSGSQLYQSLQPDLTIPQQTAKSAIAELVATLPVLK